MVLNQCGGCVRVCVGVEEEINDKSKIFLLSLPLPFLLVRDCLWSCALIHCVLGNMGEVKGLCVCNQGLCNCLSLFGGTVTCFFFYTRLHFTRLTPGSFAKLSAYTITDGPAVHIQYQTSGGGGG